MNEKALELAGSFVHEYHPSASCVFIEGSSVTGEDKKNSDIDLLIIDNSQSSSLLRCCIYKERKLEVFIYDEQSLKNHFESSRITGVPTIIRMCAKGIIVCGEENGRKLQEVANKYLIAGPDLLSETDVLQSRYQISDLLDDFIDCNDFGQELFIVNELLDSTVNLVLRGNGRWLGGGKWSAKRLKSYNHEVYSTFLEAFESYIKHGDKKGLYKFIEDELNQFGGKLFSGYQEVFQVKNHYTLPF